MESIAFLNEDEILYDDNDCYDDVEDVFYDDEYDDSYVFYAEEEKTLPGASCTPWEAFVYSMNKEGRINLRYMSEISGLTVNELIEELAGKVMWRDHRIYTPLLAETDGWVTKEQYLCDNIFEMLKEVKALHKKTGLFADNLELLKSVKPSAPLKEEIEITPGVSWVPKQYYEQFIMHLTGVKEQPELSYDDYNHKWIVEKIGAILDIRRNNAYFGTEKMSALQIFLHIMNVREIRITRKINDYLTGADKYELDEEATMAAIEKRDLILEEFKLWLKTHPAILKNLQEIYSKTFGYTVCRYDVPILTFPGLNPEVELYKNQKEAIARIILSPNNVLISHSVGAGKTYIFEIGVYECIRMGLYQKALIVVPNAVLDDAVKSFQYLYPECEILSVYPEEFNDDRAAVLDKMKAKKNRIVLMAESSFNLIDMSKDFYLKKMAEEIKRARKHLTMEKVPSKRERKMEKIRRLVKEYETYEKEFEPTMLHCFEELGVDLLVVDECHHYKNVTMDHRSNAVTGAVREGSVKSDLLVMKTEHIREKEGKLVATATPLYNSLADLFVLQQYLQPEVLKILKISKFHEWLNTFCHQTSDYEVAPDSNYLVMKSRFTKFHNLPELMAIFGQVSDSYEISEEEFDLPYFAGYENIVVKKLPEQAEEFKKILKRSQKIHLGVVKPKEDNMLKITADGRSCSLDIRILHPEIRLPANALTKSRVCAAKIAEINKAYPDRTQVVFCDISTPKTGFNVYRELKQQLMSFGFTEDEVAFVHDGTTNEKRRNLLDEFNEGKIKVMIGSTVKLGTGVNVQKKIVAVHHLDAPWRPADMVQRDGRAIRQGNTSDQVFVFRYVTEGSFDAYMWQILENKQKFIASFLAGTMNEAEREKDDIGTTILTYAEVKALAIGDPLIRERVETVNSLERYRISQRRRRKELIEINNFLSTLPAKLERQRQLIREIEKDMDYYEENKSSMTEANRTEFGEELLHALSDNAMKEKESLFDWYQEFEVILPAGMNPEKPYVLVRREQGSQTHKVMMEKSKPLGCCMRLDYLFHHLSDRKNRLLEKLALYENQHMEAKEQLKKGNQYDALVEEAEAKIKEIDSKLRKEI